MKDMMLKFLTLWLGYKRNSETSCPPSCLKSCLPEDPLIIRLNTARGQTSCPSPLPDGPCRIVGTKETVERVAGQRHDLALEGSIWCTCFVQEET